MNKLRDAILEMTSQLIKRQRVRLWSGRSQVQVEQSCKRLAMAEHFFGRSYVARAQGCGNGSRQLVTRFSIIPRVYRKI